MTPGIPAAGGGGERPGDELLDRENDLVAIDEGLAAVGRAAGAVMLIEGPAGIGKTALLGRLRHRANQLRGFLCRRRAGESLSAASGSASCISSWRPFWPAPVPQNAIAC